MKNKILLIFLIIVVLFSLPQEAISKNKFSSTGYFKQNKYRFFVYSYDSKNISKKDILKHGNNLMHTKGYPTISFYYDDINKAVNPTNCQNYNCAWDMVEKNNEWKYRYMKSPNGKTGVEVNY